MKSKIRKEKSGEKKREEEKREIGVKNRGGTVPILYPCFLQAIIDLKKNREEFLKNSRGEDFPVGHNIYPCVMSKKIKNNVFLNPIGREDADPKHFLSTHPQHIPNQ